MNTNQDRALSGTVTRRQLIFGAGGGLAALALAGLAGYEWPRKSAVRAASLPIRTSVPGEAQFQSFVSRPDLRPPRVGITSLSSDPGRPGYIFLAPRTYVTGGGGQQGLMIIDRQGRLVWWRPATSQPFDLLAQAYQAKPVLTWWQGKVVYTYGEGIGEMAGSDYTGLQQIRAGDGLQADLHELQLTSSGTALLTAYQVVTEDLSKLGGAKKGQVVTGHIQEVDLASGKVLWDWDSLDHVGLAESYAALAADEAYDYFHVNSIAEMPDGQLLVSARNTWALYKIDRASGKIVSRLGGKRSDFTFGAGARFYWQHDARPHGASAISVFDDGSSPAEERQSRGLLLDVSSTRKHVSLRQAYQHPAAFLAANQGNVQVLADGRVFVGWGNQPYFSEFAPGGELLLQGELPFGYHSYRALTYDWEATPAEAPAAAALANPAGGTEVFASWNGSTAVERWVVLAGKERSSLGEVGSQDWTGFETAVVVNSSGPWFSVVATGRGGSVLARSEPVKVGQAQ